MVWGKNSLHLSKMTEFYKKYSVPKVDLSADKLGGARPTYVDFLEVGAYRLEDYSTLLKLDLSNFSEPIINVKDYSDVYEKLVLNTKKGSVGNGTIISDSEFEHLKYFYNLLEKNDEMSSYINELLEKNPLFPLEIV